MHRRLSRPALREVGWILLFVAAGAILIMSRRAPVVREATSSDDIATAATPTADEASVNWAGYELNRRLDYRSAGGTWKTPKPS